MINNTNNPPTPQRAPLVTNKRIDEIAEQFFLNATYPTNTVRQIKFAISEVRTIYEIELDMLHLENERLQMEIESLQNKVGDCGKIK